MRSIPGEYDCVARQSMAPARLRKAHETSCKPEDAFFLIAVMHEKHFPGTAMPIVKLRKPIRGKNTARGRGGMKRGRGYVSLPINPMVDKTQPYGYLRVGLVVHEYAHAFEMLKFRQTSHGIRFTVILDSLLAETEQYWPTTRSVENLVGVK